MKNFSRVFKNKISIPYLTDLIIVIILSGTFVSPFFVHEEIYDPTRMGKIFFFVRWILFVIPFALYAFIKNLKQPINTLSLFVLIWFTWIFLRGKFGGILNDEKFFWFAGCFAFFFLAEAVIINSVKKKQVNLILIPSVVITLVAAIEATLGLLQLYGKFHVYHGLYKISGTFFNPAPYAGFLLASIPFALYLTSIKRKNIIHNICYWLGYVSVLLIIIAIPSTRSRAAYLGFITITITIVWVFYRYKPNLYIKRILKLRRNRILAFTVIPVFFIALFTGLYLFKKDSADGRLVIWKVTLQTIKEKPLIGHGFNTVQATLAPAQAAYFSLGKGTEGEEMLADSVRWAFNEPLQTASETGLVGLLFFLLVTGYALFYKIPKSSSRSIYLKVGTARASLTGVLVFGCFSYPFYSLPLTILLFYSLAVLSSFNSNAPVRINSVVTGSSKVLLFAEIVLLGVFYVIQTPKLKHAYWLWDEATTLYQMNVYNNANESFAETYPMLKHNGLFLQQYAKSLAMEGKNNESIDMLLAAGNYYKDEFSCIALGDNYKATGDYINAEEQYLLAANMVPHKFYPLYLLAKLYNETGQKEKAVSTAQSVMDKNVKVESTAIEEIKAEMKTIVDNHERLLEKAANQS